MLITVKCRVRVIVLVIGAFLIDTGCSVKIHKSFAFTEPEIQLSNGSIRSKLRGTMTDFDATSVSKAPYEMLIWFSLQEVENMESCSVSLSSLTLKNLENNELIAMSKTALSRFKKKKVTLLPVSCLKN